MRVVITEWGLQSYLDLRHRNVFSRDDYWNVIRPDVERLKDFPTDPKFLLPKFWGSAIDLAGRPIPGGFKMKWHQVGPGLVQLRLAVAVLHGEALLCQAYVKGKPADDNRHMAKFKHHLSLITAGHYIRRGYL